MAEPLRGTFELDISSFREYIPAAHILFLENAAIRVVAVSYTLEEDALISQLE